LNRAITKLVIALSVIAGSIWATKKWWGSSDGAISLVTFLTGFISLIISICSLMEILKITLAPKIYLIEYAASLIK
jgi:hypothetical protein